MAQAGEQALILGVILAFIKALEKAYDVKAARSARAKGGDPLHVLQALLEKMQGEIHETWDVHLGPAARDEDGVLRWYVPRTWMATLSEVIKMLGAVLALLERERDGAERQERRVEQMEKNQIIMMARMEASDHGRI